MRIRVCNWSETLYLPTIDEAKNMTRTQWIGACILLLLTLCMFGGVLFTGSPPVLSNGQNDLASQFIYWRAFAADQLRHGCIPLWNPHVFSGTPFLGWGQAGVLYPPNWLDMLLPLPLSINLGVALHVFLAGLFTYFWGLRRGLHPFAAVTAGALFMLSGAYFLHIYAGHLSLLCAIAWMPLVLTSVEGWNRTRTRGWILLGAAAIAMQIFAGDMQACFYTAVTAVLLLAFNLINAKERSRILLGFTAMYVVALCLGAVQLLTSFQAASESVRAGGVGYRFASMVSFAPENLLTLLAPGFFGNMFTTTYWGQWYLWEMCLFIGITGLSLAVYGAVCGQQESRRTLVPLVAVTLVLAMGSNTPLFRLLYHWIPGFNRFRGSAKFIIEASLFMAILAGAGLDRLIQNPPRHKWFALGLALAGILVGAAALELRATALSTDPQNGWARTMQHVYATQASDLPAEVYTHPSSVKQAGMFAAKCLFVASAEFLVLSGLVLLCGVSPKVVYVIGLTAIAEIFVFARSSQTTFDPSSIQSPTLQAFLDQHPGDYRIYYPRNDNIAMALDKEDIWGYAPLALKRYAEFMAFTQGQPPQGATQYLDFTRLHPLHALLRWRYAFIPGTDGDHVVTAKSVMPHLQLFQEYRVVHQRDEIFRTMISPDFNHQQQVILETDPHPIPSPFPEKGNARIIDSSASQMTIEADLPHPAILLITDAYSNGWRARPLGDTAQTAYQVLPADYTIQAVPLSARSSSLSARVPSLGLSNR